MFSYIKIVALLIALFIAMFVAVEALNIGLLRDPTSAMDKGGIATALLGIALLAADVIIPVPASLIMVINGALFGVYFGTVISMVGGLAAFIAAFLLGKKGSPLISKWTSEEDRRSADTFLENWGLLAIIISRPFPILAETIAIMAGTSAMTISKGVLAALLGLLPVTVLYALIGAIAATFTNLILAFIFVLSVAMLIWLALQRLEKRSINTQ